MVPNLKPRIMKLKKYGVVLRRMTHDDIEMVRNWRNSEFVQQFMNYRDYITPEMQEAWFLKVNNADNYYYIIEYEDDKIGVIHEKNLDRQGTGTTESGIFVATEAYLSTFIPVAASLILIEINFYLLNGKDSFIRILRDNHRSISYNKTLGYVLCEGQEDETLQKYTLTRANFERRTRKLRQAISRQTGSDQTFSIILEPCDQESGFAAKFLEFLQSYPYRSIRIDHVGGDIIISFPLDVDTIHDNPLIDPSIYIEPLRY